MNALGSYKVPNGDDSQVADYTPQTEETDFGGTESVDPGRDTAELQGPHLGRTVDQQEYYTDSLPE